MVKTTGRNQSWSPFLGTIPFRHDRGFHNAIVCMQMFCNQSARLSRVRRKALHVHHVERGRGIMRKSTKKLLEYQENVLGRVVYIIPFPSSSYISLWEVRLSNIDRAKQKIKDCICHLLAAEFFGGTTGAALTVSHNFHLFSLWLAVNGNTNSAFSIPICIFPSTPIYLSNRYFSSELLATNRFLRAWLGAMYANTLAILVGILGKNLTGLWT